MIHFFLTHYAIVVYFGTILTDYGHVLSHVRHDSTDFDHACFGIIQRIVATFMSSVLAGAVSFCAFRRSWRDRF